MSSESSCDCHYSCLCSAGTIRNPPSLVDTASAHTSFRACLTVLESLFISVFVSGRDEITPSNYVSEKQVLIGEASVSWAELNQAEFLKEARFLKVENSMQLMHTNIDVFPLYPLSMNALLSESIQLPAVPQTQSSIRSSVPVPVSLPPGILPHFGPSYKVLRDLAGTPTLLSRYINLIQ